MAAVTGSHLSIFPFSFIISWFAPPVRLAVRGFLKIRFTGLFLFGAVRFMVYEFIGLWPLDKLINS
jgi:hypothetical protein